jgi:hypothetical protein
MTLIRGGVITGTIRDERGRALPGVTVTALRYAVSFQTGERILDYVSIGSSGLTAQNFAADVFPGTSVTDDRGLYRIYGLPPGEYLISASVRSPYGNPTLSTDVRQVTAADLERARRLLQDSAGAAAVGMSRAATERAMPSRVDYAPVYHPASIGAADAVTIGLGASEEKSGVDVLMRLVATARVSGVVTAFDGSPVAGAQVSIMDPESSSGRVMRLIRSNLDGEFAIAGIAPGRYQMQGSLYSDGLFGTTEVLVEGRDISTSFVLWPGMTVSGRLVFDGTTAAPEFSAVPLLLLRQRFATGAPRFQMSSDGTFVFRHVPPGSYRLRTTSRPPAGWVLRSAVVNGADASDVPFEVRPNENIEGVVVTMTSRSAEITGTLQTADGKPAPEYVLVVCSADARYRVPRSRRTQHVRPDVAGRFIVRDLPAGDYLISAVTDIEDGQWNDPAFLAELASSSPIRISLAEGDRKVQNIRIGGR